MGEPWLMIVLADENQLWLTRTEHSDALLATRILLIGPCATPQLDAGIRRPLRGASDEELHSWALAEGAAIATANKKDLARLNHATETKVPILALTAEWQRTRGLEGFLLGVTTLMEREGGVRALFEPSDENPAACFPLAAICDALIRKQR